MLQGVAEGLGLPERQLVEGRAAADQLVVVRHVLDPLRWNAAAGRHDLEEWPDVLGLLGPAEGDQKHNVDVAHRADSSWTMATSAFTLSTGVS